MILRSSACSASPVGPGTSAKPGSPSVRRYAAPRPRQCRWMFSSGIFRTNVTGRFGNVTAEFGNVTGRFGNVTGRFGNVTGRFGNVTGRRIGPDWSGLAGERPGPRAGVGVAYEQQMWRNLTAFFAGEKSPQPRLVTHEHGFHGSSPGGVCRVQQVSGRHLLRCGSRQYWGRRRHGSVDTLVLLCSLAHIQACESRE